LGAAFSGALKATTDAPGRLAARRATSKGHLMTGLVTKSDAPRPAAHKAAISAASIGSTPIALPPLPFADTALEPAISARTLGFHHGKHHQGYVTKLLGLVEGTPMATMTLEEIILATAGDEARRAIYNNAAQAWNHGFYWQSLSPEAQEPSAELAAAIVRDFGTLDELKAKLVSTATAHFGSGWAWLVKDSGKLAVVSTPDADVPFIKGQVPLLTIDVWEHAYYLDWQNGREGHVKAIVNGYVNWEFAGRNFTGS